MKKLLAKILFLVLFLVTQLNSQEHIAYIEIDPIIFDKENYYSIAINGIEIDKQNMTIPINNSGFDTIKYSTNQKNSFETLLKFQQNKKYNLDFNHCSLFTIKPVENPMQGMVKFIIESENKNEYLVGIEFMRKLNKNKTDKFYYSPPSVMCAFAEKHIQIKTIEEKFLAGVKYNFLHGELLVITYNAENKNVELKNLGYITNKSEYNYYNE